MHVAIAVLAPLAELCEVILCQYFMSSDTAARNQYFQQWFKKLFSIYESEVKLLRLHFVESEKIDFIGKHTVRFSHKVQH